MTYNFCTIATADYLPFVRTLFHSLKTKGLNCVLHVFLTSNERPPEEIGIEWYLPEDFYHHDNFILLFEKYRSNSNNLRWSLKPFFLSQLLQKVEKIIYLDNDVFFFNKYDFLFDELDTFSFLLTPHWTCFEPIPYFDNFKISYQIGLFNAGFIGANRRSLSTLNWWLQLCLNRMEINIAEGFYVDQRYLDMAMIVDQNAGILRHLGCNVASINMHQNTRVKSNDNVLIEGKFPIVFIHFNGETITHIQNRNDSLLRPYYDAYQKAFALTGFELTDYRARKKDISVSVDIKRRLKIRTRLKQFVFRVYQKL